MGQAGVDRQSSALPHTERSFHPSSWLTLPSPIRLMFDRFPIHIYEYNDLPQRCRASRAIHELHIFTDGSAELSPNPACLKWQLSLKFHNIPFTTRSSNNHASPAGALPFVLPAMKPKQDILPQAITSSKIQRWAETQGAAEEQAHLKLDTYLALIDQNIRNAWLFHLYLHPQNFKSVARPLYIDTTSSNTLVQSTLAHQLQSAAREQLSRTASFIDAEEIYQQAGAAFEALSTLLADDDFFSKTGTPCLFDASLVAFTHLILEFMDSSATALRWKDNLLPNLLLQHPRLVGHRDRVIRFTEHAKQS